MEFWPGNPLGGPRRGYGLGGPSPRDIVNTDEPRVIEPVDTGVAISQPTTFPSDGDYDTPDNLIFDLNNQMPYHEGNAPRDAERGFNLDEIVEGREDAPGAPDSTYSMWSDSYADGEVHLGQTDRAPWVAVDLDGTLLEDPPMNDPAHGSHEQQIPFGAPKEGAAQFLAELAQLGWRISIYTARFGDESLDDATIARWAKEVADHLERNELTFSDIWVGRKPRCDFFVDDKAVLFDGDYDYVLQQLVSTHTPRQPGIEEAPIGPSDPSDPSDVTEDARAADRGPLDYAEDPNDFNDPLGDRHNNGVSRPSGLEEVLFG